MPVDACANARLLPKFILMTFNSSLGSTVSMDHRWPNRRPADGRVTGVVPSSNTLWPHHAAPLLQKLALNGVAKHLRVSTVCQVFRRNSANTASSSVLWLTAYASSSLSS